MSTKRRWAIRVTIISMIAVATVPFWWTAPPPPTPANAPNGTAAADTQSIPLTPPAASPFLNTGPQAHYVGSQACRDCHQDETDSFALSGMAHSMRTVDLDVEPPDTTISHQLSNREFKTTRRDGQLFHSEKITGGSQPWIVGEHDIKYIVGSGVHFSMYLCEIDGFLVESPLTWYVAKPEWSLSPGYDSPHHLGFQREITAACLFCHAGRATAIDDSYHRMQVEELGISCERCHGPGSLHVAKHNTAPDKRRDLAGDKFDTTIVNPARLDRHRAEAVCHQCHLQSQAYVNPRGRSLADYRPGLALEDFQHYYRSADPGQKMKVVGHAEQMMLSRCYTNSDTLNCITCHNPHGTPAVADQPAHYRRICLDCHKANSPTTCTADNAARQQTLPANNCVSCHMPTIPTTTLHTAVTHHRIGLHSTTTTPSPASSPTSSPDQDQHATTDELEPLHDLSRYHQLDRQRSLGLATLKRVFQLGIDSGPRSQRLWNQSRTLLMQARKGGLVDPGIEATLAQLTFDTNKGQAVRHATSALSAPTIDIESRLNALFALASFNFSQKRPAKSLEYLDELIRIRRSASDWEMRGLCQLQLRKRELAIESLRTAVSIDPELLPVHDILARLYADVGQASDSAHHRRHVRRLQAIFRDRRP